MSPSSLASIHHELQDLIPQILSLNLKLTTAESCTGGMLASLLTEYPGSSAWFDRGFVTYSNEAKIDLLNVSPVTLKTQGAVSEAVVKEMAFGALKHSLAQVSFAITGIAGPSGGSLEKPIGTVWIAVAFQDQAHANLFHFQGPRQSVREQACLCALMQFKSLILAHKA
jgi:nicotinamide-nucleotide amidase